MLIHLLIFVEVLLFRIKSPLIFNIKELVSRIIDIIFLFLIIHVCLKIFCMNLILRKKTIIFLFILNIHLILFFFERIIH